MTSCLPLIAQLVLIGGFLGAASSAAAKPRLAVLTDIGGDPDDQQSLVRLLLHSNDLDIEGLVASAAGTPSELKEDQVRPDLIRQYVDAYEQVRPSLLRHDRRYPPAKRLRSVIKAGNPHRGVANVGEGQDTEGSRFIIRLVDRPDPRPLAVAVWGGPTELAQALWRIRKDRSPSGVRRFVSKIRVHAIGHQDDSGPWILENFPELWYVLDNVTDVPRKERLASPDRRDSVYRGMYLGGDMSLTSAEWISRHVRQGHGPLGALYPAKTWTAPNPHGSLKEGDTPSWFYFLENGLQDPSHPEWGGWGGRFQRGERSLFRDAADTVAGVTHAQATVWRWRPDFQNELAARMDWCTKPFQAANHAPQAVLDRDSGHGILVRRIAPGTSLQLDGSGSSDPDGHRLGYRWWVYREAGTYERELAFRDGTGPRLKITVPAEAAGKTIHLILEVRDDGSPALKAYRRVVLDVSTRP